MKPLPHAFIATALLCMATIGYTQHMPEFPRFFAGLNDFLPRYTQARMVGTHQMYSIEQGFREQERAIGEHIPSAYHDRLPWQALLMVPLGKLPYLWAYWAWIGLHLAAFGLFVVLWLLPRDIVLWGATFFPLAISIFLGQDALLIALGLVGVMRLAASRREFAAGLLLALCAVKPHLFVLIPLVLIAYRRWRVLQGAVGGTVGLLLAGTWAAGLDWPLRLLGIMRTLFAASGVDVHRRPSIFQLGTNEWTVGAALVLVVVFGLLIWRTKTLEAAMGLAIIGGILVAPHTLIYDLPLLLVALPLLPLNEYGKWIRVALYTPVPYWALLNGQPWSLLVPVMLLGVVAASVWPLKDRQRSLQLEIVQA